MILSSHALAALILKTEALNIWKRETGPVFWYTMNVPGPFYINTELLLGQELSIKLLTGIDGILAKTKDSTERAHALEAMMLDAWGGSETFRDLVETLVAKAKESFAEFPAMLVSGGERRDWLFSIPFAHVAQKSHIYLFKDETPYCDAPTPHGTPVLHVSDLINNAASIINLWIPQLAYINLPCAGNLSVISRGDVGLNKLADIKQKTVCLAAIETDFFVGLVERSIIDAGTLEEIALFMKSERDWAAHYLMQHPDVFQVGKINAKSLARLQHFLSHDPWHMRKEYPEAFARIEQEIALRK